MKKVNNPESKNYFSERVRDFEKIFPDEKKILEYGEQKEFVKSFREEQKKKRRIIQKKKERI